jgi:gluconate kinase
MSYKICLISGLSGTGKTTIAKQFISEVSKNWVWIDQDSFYIQKKPLVRLSNGEEKQNWDCTGAIDWKRLNDTVIQESQHHNVLLVGFAPWDIFLRFKVDSHIHLLYGNDRHRVIQRCINTRKQSKGFTDPNKKLTDELMVREVVYPFYIESLQSMSIHAYLDVYNGDQRVPLDVLVKQVYNLLIS